jgi:hypothetical protein
VEYIDYNAKLVTNHVGQTGKSQEIRHSEHIRYIKTNNHMSAYTLHILKNIHEYGNSEYTMQLLNTCSKGKIMNCWETFYMQMLQHNLLIDKQKVTEPNSLYALANIMKQHITQPDTHSDSVHTRLAH